VTEESWPSDAAYQASTAEDFQSRYVALLDGVELWLPGDFETWRRGGADVTASFEQKARFALAVMLPLARRAVGVGLPMKLDY